MPRCRGTARGPAALLAAAVLAGIATACGSSTSTEPSKSADQIYTDALDRLAQAPGVHFHGSATFTDGTRQTVDARAGADTVRALVTQGSQSFTVVVTGGRAWAGAGGRWTAITGNDAVGVQSLTLRLLVSCARREHGNLTKGGDATVDGHAAVIIVDDGKAPGAAPSRTFVATDGPPLLLRSVQTGRETPGGTLTCGHNPSNPASTSGTVDFEVLGSAPDVTPPPASASGGSVI